MKIEQLRMDNLREGIFCANGTEFADEWYGELEAWLDGGRLKGQVARDDDGTVIGFVLYYPIEQAPMEIGGEGLYMVQCIQVKPPHDKEAVAKAMIESAIADARSSGASGVVAEGLAEMEPLHDHVTAAFLEDLGLKKGPSRGFATLYYSVFDRNAREPHYLPQRLRSAQKKAKLQVDVMSCKLCYVGIQNRETVLKAVERSKSDRVEVTVHDQTSRPAVIDKGFSTGVFIDGKLTFFRQPVSEGDVINAIDIADSARRRAIDR